MGRRARVLAMLGAAAVCAGLAASAVNSYTSEVRAQVGPLVPVVVARTEIAKGRRITPRSVRSYLSERRVPARFVPPSALRLASAALGYRALTRIRAGDYVSENSLGADTEERSSRFGAPSRGRLVAVPVAGAQTIASALRPGARVDVLITTDRGAATPRTYLALQRIELVDFGGASDSIAGSEGARDATATLRVTLRQAVLLTAARNFARELRLVPRVEGDDRRVGPASVTAAGLAR
jgi:Flp pilus assembly protein CpaB